MEGRRKIYVILILIALGLVFVGSFGAYLVHTSGYKVKITDMTLVTEDGARMAALLYVPNSVTVENPAPAIVSMHGYNNTKEVQDLNCVELARRGYVVIAIDAYDHGRSSFADPRIRKGIAPDMGTYAALQYLGTLPYVDKNRIGMVGHSLGGICLQIGAMRAFTKHEKDPHIIVPRALVPTEHTFLVKEGKLVYEKYPVHVGLMFGKYDEWAENMWKVPTADKINTSPNGIAGMGFSGAKYNTYYVFGENKPLSREEAIAAVKEGKPLRAIFQPEIVHPRAHFSRAAVAYILEFFNLTLKEGKESLPPLNQVWYWKQICTGLALVGFFLFIIPFAFLLLETSYFGTILKPEPEAPSVISGVKNKIVYWFIFIVCLLPAPLLYNWAVGYPIAIKSFGRSVPTVMPVNNYFQLPAVNGLVLLLLLVGGILLVIFLLTYILFMKKNGVTFDQLGIKLSGAQVGKAALLSVIVFLATYFLLVLMDFFFQSDARFYVFSFRPLTPIKFWILLKYLPFFLFFYLINVLLLNSFTRIRGKGEGLNILLMIIANVGGLAVLSFLDYWWLFQTGIKMFPYVPYPPSPKTTSALAGVLLWNVLFFLPLAAISARLFFRKTGTIWLGAFINSLVATLFAISNTVISAGCI
ncbi:MAG: acetylxylan esterase [Syntrophales bacterium]|nr:acetylxylan esterase [Syntrophales bacterium]